MSGDRESDFTVRCWITFACAGFPVGRFGTGFSSGPYWIRWVRRLPLAEEIHDAFRVLFVACNRRNAVGRRAHGLRAEILPSGGSRPFESRDRFGAQPKGSSEQRGGKETCSAIEHIFKSIRSRTWSSGFPLIDGDASL